MFYKEDVEVESFDVELVKDTKGLGITIAGYVGEKTSGKKLNLLQFVRFCYPIFQVKIIQSFF
mgnify:FL=1